MGYRPGIPFQAKWYDIILFPAWATYNTVMGIVEKIWIDWYVWRRTK